MPTISVFYGISIMMYLRDKEHNPPHIHAFYGDDAAAFCISDGELLHGYLPKRAQQMVKEFIFRYQKELLAMWDGAPFSKLKGLE